MLTGLGGASITHQMLLSSATACELLPAGKGGQIANVGAGLTCGRGIGAPCGGGLERLGGRWRRGGLASSLKSRFEVRLNAMPTASKCAWGGLYCFEVCLNEMTTFLCIKFYPTPVILESLN